MSHLLHAPRSVPRCFGNPPTRDGAGLARQTIFTADANGVDFLSRLIQNRLRGPPHGLRAQAQWCRIWNKFDELAADYTTRFRIPAACLLRIGQSAQFAVRSSGIMSLSGRQGAWLFGF
jgi:hypothetical protein